MPTFGPLPQGACLELSAHPHPQTLTQACEMLVPSHLGVSTQGTSSEGAFLTAQAKLAPVTLAHCCPVEISVMMQMFCSYTASC